MTFPTANDPYGSGVRRQCPTARQPYPAVMTPDPLAFNPHIFRSGSGHDLLDNCRRRWRAFDGLGL